MQEYIAEFIGTFFLTFVVLWTGSALMISIALFISIYFGGAYSSAAFNPAVAIALVAVKKLPSSDFIGYVIAEIAGTLVAFELVKLLKKK
jgi:glycerol uptake facilitator-like aquaporin